MSIILSPQTFQQLRNTLALKLGGGHSGTERRLSVWDYKSILDNRYRLPTLRSATTGPNHVNSQQLEHVKQTLQHNDPELVNHKGLRFLSDNARTQMALIASLARLGVSHRTHFTSLVSPRSNMSAWQCLESNSKQAFTRWSFLALDSVWNTHFFELYAFSMGCRWSLAVS